MRKSVVLPQPDGPSKTRHSPGSTTRSSGSRARVLPAKVLPQRVRVIFVAMACQAIRPARAAIDCIAINSGTIISRNTRV